MKPESAVIFTKLKEKKHIVAGVTLLLYALILIFQYPIIDLRVSIFAAIPIMIIPFLYGLRTGVINFAVITFAATPILLSIIAREVLYLPYIKESGLGILMGAIATVIIGHIHDLHHRIDILNAKLMDLARIDPLTQINNRRAFYEQLEQAFYSQLEQTFIRTDKPEETQESTDKNKAVYSVALLDIDNFKDVNDQYGHLMGDEVLIRLAAFLNSGNHGLRATDVVGRFGGEEYIVLLPETCAEDAVGPLNRLKDLIRKELFTSDKGEEFSISFSCGVSQFSPDDDAFIDIIHRADQALYYAKEHGRDSIEVR